MESLVPFMGDKKQKGEEPTIIVDSREAKGASKIFKGLTEKGVIVKTQMLDKGDYEIGRAHV
jgi:ERCC4-type nuclease